jgi:MFS family permease
MGVGQRDIGAMYSLYSWGAIFTLLAAGWLIDRFGTRRSSLIFSGVITLGAVVVALAPDARTLLAGRFIFGAGSEALIVTQSAILARWFKGKELALAFGVSLAIMRLGTMFSFNTEALIAERLGASAALWVAAGLCLASALSTLVYIALDRHAEPVIGLREETAGDRIVWGDVLKFKRSYWYLTVLCVCFYSAIFPFTALSTNFFHEKWGLPLVALSDGGFLSAIFQNFRHMFTTAPGTTSIITFASMCFAPFAGALIDRIGRRASIMILGCILMVVSYVVLAFSHIAPAMPMIVLGGAFILVPAALWPAVPLLVRQNRLGTAFGVMTLIQNVGLMAFPWLNGLLREVTSTYTASMMMFATLGLVALLAGIFLKLDDMRKRSVLELP